MTVYCLPHINSLSNSLCHSHKSPFFFSFQLQIFNKKVWVFSFSLHNSCFEHYFLKFVSCFQYWISWGFVHLVVLAFTVATFHCYHNCISVLSELIDLYCFERAICSILYGAVHFMLVVIYLNDSYLCFWGIHRLHCAYTPHTPVFLMLKCCILVPFTTFVCYLFLYFNLHLFH